MTILDSVLPGMWTELESVLLLTPAPHDNDQGAYMKSDTRLREQLLALCAELGPEDGALTNRNESERRERCSVGRRNISKTGTA